MSKFFSKALQEFDGHCAYCGKYLLADFDTFMTAQEDHLVPSSKDGPDDKNNIVIACSVCNMLKSNKIPDKITLKPENREEYIHEIRKIIMQGRVEKMKDYFSWFSKSEK